MITPHSRKSRSRSGFFMSLKGTEETADAEEAAYNVHLFRACLNSTFLF